MSTRGAALRNTLFSSVGIYTEYFLGMLTSIVIARHLGPGEFGAYSLVIWLVAGGVAATNSGAASAVIKYVAELRGAGRMALIRPLLSWLRRAQLAFLSVVMVAGAVLFALSALWCGLTAPRPLLPPRADLAGVLVFLVAFAGVAAFSAVPSAPQAQYPLNGVGAGLVHSARWPVMSIDNVLPYRTGQVALHKLGGEQVRDGYSPGWWIVDRGPLTGLAFAFASSVGRGDVPPDDIQAVRPMITVKDSYGFWAYGIVAIMFNMAIVLAVYLLGHVWRGRRIALVAALVTALAPGIVLNALYTWPKQAVAYFVLVGAVFALRRRPLLAGAVGTLGDLSHPGGLYWIPAIGVLLWLVAREHGDRRPLRRLAAFAGAAIAVALPWQLFCSLVVGASSRWTFSPLGYVIDDRTDALRELGPAWDGFRERGLLDALWVRTESLVMSLVPQDLMRTPVVPPGGSRGHEIGLLWIEAHGYAFWGMVGLALVPVALAVAIRRWPEARTLLVGFVVPGLAMTWLGAGFLPPFISQNAFAVVGVIALLAAGALVTIAPRWRLLLVAAIAFELLTVVWPVLYEPVNVSAGPKLLFTGAAVLAQLALIVALAFAVEAAGTGALRRMVSRALSRSAPAAGQIG